MTNYSYFTEQAKKNIDEPGARAWLDKSGITEGTAAELGLGYFDPAMHADLREYLERRVGAELGGMGAAIIVPVPTGGYYGILTDRAGYMPNPPGIPPRVWGEESLVLDETVLMVSDIRDALAFRARGASCVCFDSEAVPYVAGKVKGKAKASVLVPQTLEYLETAEKTAEVLAGKGVPVIVYRPPEGCPPAASLLASDPGKLDGIIADIGDYADEGARARRAAYEQLSALNGLDGFRGRMGDAATRSRIPTGIGGLDAILGGGLSPGLYVLGAVSSQGKTTLALQIADHIADHPRGEGPDVLFFTLEQSRDELMAKSLSRLTKTAFADSIRMERLTAPEILYRLGDWAGDVSREAAFEGAVDEYRDGTAPNMFIIEDASHLGRAGRIGLDDIGETVERHVEITGRAPVVFVDYLQILRGDDPRESDKQRVDETVSGLRVLSRTHSVPVFAISSLNRSSYNQRIGMDAFKESGAIEYSSDVLLSLGPDGLGTGDREAKTNRDRYDEDAGKPVRDMALEVLKNRMGPRGKILLTFDAPFCHFSERKAAPEDTEDDTEEYEVPLLRGRGKSFIPWNQSRYSTGRGGPVRVTLS